MVNVFIKEPTFSNVEAELNHAEKTGNHEKLASVYKHLIQTDSLNVDWHYHYIHQQFDVIKESPKTLTNLQDYLIIYYETLTHSRNDSLSDIGRLSLGMILYNSEMYKECLEQWAKIKNQDIKYLNNYYGLMYLSIDDSKAEEYFKREIAWGGDQAGAYKNLAYLYNSTKQDEKLFSLIDEQKDHDWIPLKVQRQLYLRSGDMKSYFKTLYKRFKNAFQLVGIAGAFLVSMIWLFYLRKIDFTSRFKPIWQMFMVWFFSMFFAFLTTLLTDVNKYIVGYSLKGTFVNDFVYSVLGIGAIEELMKIIPFLLILNFTKWIKEPVDYLFYACVCALGFSFMENMLYFTDDGIRFLQGRALTATFSHMFDSSIIAYGLVLARFTNKNKLLYFIISFAIASFMHGFYDFWLIYPVNKVFNLFTLVFLLISMFMWMSMLNNCLNNSTWISKTMNYNQKKVFAYLLTSLSLVFVFEYVSISFKFGPAFAELYTLKGMSSGLFLLLFITFSLTKIDHVQHYWAPIKFWDWQTVLNVPSLKPQFFNLQEILGQSIRLNAFRSSSPMFPHLPASGTIIARELISWEKDWYLVKLDNPIFIGWKKVNYLLIKNRKIEEPLLKHPKQIVYLRMVTDLEMLEKKLKKKSDFPLLDFALLSKE